MPVTTHARNIRLEIGLCWVLGQDGYPRDKTSRFASTWNALGKYSYHSTVSSNRLSGALAPQLRLITERVRQSLELRAELKSERVVGASGGVVTSSSY